MSARTGWLKGEVSALYERNRQRGHAAWAGCDYDFVCPSMATYPFQWFWDSCFHAVVLSHLDVERAKSEVRGLLKNQQPDGFIGHVTFWQRERFEELLSTYSIAYRTPYVSDCMQPPLLAEAAEAVIRRGGGDGFLLEVLPGLARYYDWLDRVRDPDQDGLVAVVQPDETGLDHTPKFDAYLGISTVDHAAFTSAWERVCKPYDLHGRSPPRMFEEDRFIVEEVMVNTLYALNQEVLATLFARVGDSSSAQRFQARADRTVSALLAKCWDEEAGLFFDLAGHVAEKKLGTNTFTCLMPLALPRLPRTISARLIAHLESAQEYGARFPVPSVAMNERTFQAGVVGTKLVWRGPTWMNSNWYLARGLRLHGREDLAARVTDASVALIQQSGFREYYNPHTGEGHGAEDFSWSALALDLALAQEG